MAETGPVDPDIQPAEPSAKRSGRRRAASLPTADPEPCASDRIDARLAELGGWRGAVLARVRAVVRGADPGVVEEWKWNTPVWSHHGILCTGEAYKTAVKLTFAKGALLADPAGLFNASLDGRVRRAIDLREGDTLDESALAGLIRTAIEWNQAAAPAARRGA